jgi:hypothetical protein
MKAALVLGAGRRTPVYADFREPEPVAREARIAVTAAAISHCGAEPSLGAPPIARLGNSRPEIALPGAALRSSAIVLMGSGIGSLPVDRFVHAIDGRFGRQFPRA